MNGRKTKARNKQGVLLSGLFRALAIPIHRLIMKNIMLFFSVLLYSPVFGQPVDSINREVESGKLTETVYSVTEFQRIAGQFGD